MDKTEDKLTIRFPLGQVMFVVSAVLCVLKLMGKIHLTWLQALAPIWIPPVAFLMIVTLAFLVGAGVGVFRVIRNPKGD